MKKLIALLLALVMVLSLVGCGSDSGSKDEVYNLTFSMHTPLDTPLGKYFQNMFDEISEKTDGHVNITPYGSGTLAAAPDVVDMVADGGCDIGWVYTSFYFGQYPLTDVITLFGNYPESCVQGTEVLYNLYNEFEEVSAEWSKFKVLQMHCNPVNYIYTSSDPSSLDAVSSMSLRAPSGSCADVMTELGVNVISMPPNDIYDNMSKNNINGYIIEHTAVTDYSMDEVTDYILDVPLNQGPFFVIMNKDVYDSMPAEYQAVIDEYTSLEACLDIAEVWDNQAAESEQVILEGAEFASWSDADIAAFNDVCAAYDAKWIAERSTSDFDASVLLARCRELYGQ